MPMQVCVSCSCIRRVALDMITGASLSGYCRMRRLSVLTCLLRGQIAYSIWQLSLCRQKQTNAISEQTCFSQVTGITSMAVGCERGF